jgi:hypothetical protein
VKPWPRFMDSRIAAPSHYDDRAHSAPCLAGKRSKVEVGCVMRESERVDQVLPS